MMVGERHNVAFLVGVIVGAAGAASAALLYTPLSGAETRQQLSGRVAALRGGEDVLKPTRIWGSEATARPTRLWSSGDTTTPIHIQGSEGTPTPTRIEGSEGTTTRTWSSEDPPGTVGTFGA